MSPVIATFRQSLEELGWTDGRNVRIDFRWGGGDATVMPKLAKELIERRPDVIVAATYSAVTAARQQAALINPITGIVGCCARAASGHIFTSPIASITFPI
jgi:putative tryptophan/tyrosine transport system substrate-binding protein